jgi:hypothetical protein
LADFRACALGTFSNLFFFGFPDPAFAGPLGAGRGDFSLSNPTGSTCTVDNFTAGTLNFSNLEAILPTGVALSAVFKNGTSANATSVTTRKVGADKTKFANWTWSEEANLLSDF